VVVAAAADRVDNKSLDGGALLLPHRDLVTVTNLRAIWEENLIIVPDYHALL